MRCPTINQLPPPPPGKTGWPWTEQTPQLPETMPILSRTIESKGSPWPKVSIVTPSYNQGQFIEETIRSVLLQGYPNLEYIVIDGGSTDGSIDTIRKYEPWLAYWVSEKDQGQSHAINKGFRSSQGDILAWLNSDDLLEPLAAYLAVAYLTAHTDAGMVYGDRTIVDSAGKTIGYRRVPKFVSWQLRYCSGVNQETAFWRRNLFFTTGELDSSLHYSMDYDLWWRFTRLTAIHHLPTLMGRFRAHEISKSVLTATSSNESESVERWQSEGSIVRRRYMGRDVLPVERWFLPRIQRVIACLERASGCYDRRQTYIHHLLDQVRK